MTRYGYEVEKRVEILRLSRRESVGNRTMSERVGNEYECVERAEGANRSTPGSDLEYIYVSISEVCLKNMIVLRFLILSKNSLTCYSFK